MKNCLTILIRPLAGLGSRAGILLLLVGIPVQATLADPAFDALRTRIEQGYQDRNLADLEAVRADLLDLADGGRDRPNAAYYAAYARFRQALAVGGDDGASAAAARGYLEDCIAELRVVVRQRPDHAEARALLGSCNGMSTRYGVLATMTRGLEARRQMAEARRLAPDNPWVVMQDGLADWATPRLFGGDRELAVIKLERATALFGVAMDSGSRIAAWGAAEAWLQLGQRYRELGRGVAADSAYARAAALGNPRLQIASALP